ncbi:MAG: tRNA (adenosine(37)-N6)-threonylcarbamoyltransferase complex ATPase subunit type 1 TsaE [Lachnospiraceae bacterium]
MSERIRIIESTSESDTYALGVEIGKKAKPGEVYALSGDLGVGKTALTKGVAAGLGIKEPVSSPTFTILQIYEEGRLPFYHFDVYRLEEAEEMDEIGYIDYLYGEGVSLIEWAELISEVLPSSYFKICIEKDLEKGVDYRRITVERIGT